MSEDSVEDFVNRGGKIQQSKMHKPRKGERLPGSRHIGGPGDTNSSRTRGINANTVGSKVVGESVNEGNWEKTRSGDYLNSHTGVRSNRPGNLGEPSNSDKLAYYQKELSRLKSSPNSFKSHIADAEKMIRRYSK